MRRSLTAAVALAMFVAPAVRSEPPAALTVRPTHTVSVSRGGTAQEFEIASQILNETRRVLVVLPASYARTNRKYPLAVVVDGEYLMPAIAVATDELARNSQIPEMVLVGIENAGNGGAASNEHRLYDLTPPGMSVSGSNRNQGGDRLLDFIEQELIPTIDRQFRTTAPRVFAGVSSGAVLATYAAATRPAFRVVLSLDAPVHLADNWLAHQLVARAGASSDPLRYASLESKFGWPDAEWNALTKVAPATWMLYRQRLPLETHETLQLIGAYLGFRQLFSDYSRLAVADLPAARVLPHYDDVSASLGATVVPPQRVLRDITGDLLSEGNASAARAANALLVDGYGPPPDEALLLKRITTMEKGVKPAETVESLTATPFPSPDEARSYLGEWIGDIWMGTTNPAAAKTRLRLKVQDGQIVGETVHQTPQGDAVTPWVYLRITPVGMTWGTLNGMRPRGVAVFEGTLNGDALSGEMHLRGVDPADIDGPAPPPLHFLFKRVRQH